MHSAEETSQRPQHEIIQKAKNILSSLAAEHYELMKKRKLILDIPPLGGFGILVCWDPHHPTGLSSSTHLVFDATILTQRTVQHVHWHCFVLLHQRFKPETHQKLLKYLLKTMKLWKPWETIGKQWNLKFLGPASCLRKHCFVLSKLFHRAVECFDSFFIEALSCFWDWKLLGSTAATSDWENIFAFLVFD